MFDEETRKALAKIFNSLPRSLRDYLVIARGEEECVTCSDAEKLAREINSIAGDKLVIEIVDRESSIAMKLKPRFVPAWIFDTPNHNIRYYGLPAGHEFTPFIYIHDYIANDRFKLPKEIVEKVRSIKSRLHVKVFVTPQCPYCPMVVDTLNQFGVANNNIFVETIESMELPWEADRYGVYYVPTIIVNDIERIDGYAQPSDILNLLLRVDNRVKRD